jgi:hypothetical protein
MNSINYVFPRLNIAVVINRKRRQQTQSFRKLLASIYEPEIIMKPTSPSARAQYTSLSLWEGHPSTVASPSAVAERTNLFFN